MSEKKPLRRRIRDRDLVLGTFIKTANPAVLEIVGYAGFDFAVLDCEHSNISYGQIEDSVRTGENVGLPIIVRVASANDQNIFHALDSGAAGVQLPNLSTPEQVAQSVRYAKYYPLGERGLSRSQRAAKFGFWESERPYVDSANEDTVVSVHIENEAMARRAEEICRQEQVDVLFVGPADLSQSLGIPGKASDPRVVELAAHVLETAKRYGKAGGVFVGNMAAAERYIKLGATYILLGSDTSMIAKAAKEAVADFSAMR